MAVILGISQVRVFHHHTCRIRSEAVYPGSREICSAQVRTPEISVAQIGTPRAKFANDSGGQDNITVALARVGDVVSKNAASHGGESHG